MVLSSLQKDLKWLLESEIFVDGSVEIEGTKYSFHRAILFCRCPELLKEANELMFPFGTAAGLIFKILLEFLYT